MLICPRGEDHLKKLLAKFPNLKIQPVLRLDDSTFLPNRDPEDKLLEEFSNLAGDMHERIFGAPEIKTGVSRFGFLGTGGAIVLFSNTPNNTMPIIHKNGRLPSTWKALFPRVDRESA
jgi:hypothetical protein